MGCVRRSVGNSLGLQLAVNMNGTLCLVSWLVMLQMVCLCRPTLSIVVLRVSLLLRVLSVVPIDENGLIRSVFVLARVWVRLPVRKNLLLIITTEWFRRVSACVVMATIAFYVSLVLKGGLY